MSKIKILSEVLCVHLARVSAMARSPHCTIYQGCTWPRQAAPSCETAIRSTLNALIVTHRGSSPSGIDGENGCEHHTPGESRFAPWIRR
jgi:hypothetical protein